MSFIENKEYNEAKKRWEEGFEKSTPRAKRFSTISDAEVIPLGTPDMLSEFGYHKVLGFPGQFPFTRGIQPSMYRGRFWTMRQFAGLGSAKDTNARFHYLLEHGQTGLSVAFHFPTLMGYDSDHKRSRGEVGKCGVAIDSLKDMEVLFDKIPLDQVTTSMTINGPAAVLLAMYLAVAEKQGVTWDKVGGTIQNDILKEYIAQNSWLFPPEPSIRLIVDTIEFCTNNVPKWNTISISGYHIREAGSTAVQELAFTIADGIAYVQAGIDRGLDVDSFAPRLSFFFNAHMDLFEEIAKFRAARRMWAKIMKERFAAKNPRSMQCRFHTQTAGCSLTAQQPLNNVIRTTIEALSAIIGQTQSLHTNSLDETLALPTEKAVRIALRTQQIIANESGLADVIDPFGGSYFVEDLTNKMEKEALEYIEKIDKLGGMVEAIKAGFPQKEIRDAAYHYQKQVEEGQKTIVGVNKFQRKDEPPIEILKIGEEISREQEKRLGELRAGRDNQKVENTLKGLRQAAQGDINMMPAILDAVRSYATIGEICGVLREVFGEYRDPGVF